jgi:YggT family protein
MSAVAGLVSLVLLLFQIVMIARVVVDWVAIAGHGDSLWVARVRDITHALTEPVIRPVRRLVPPARLGTTSIDLAFTIVFIAVVILRIVLNHV